MKKSPTIYEGLSLIGVAVALMLSWQANQISRESNTTSEIIVAYTQAHGGGNLIGGTELGAGECGSELVLYNLGGEGNALVGFGATVQYQDREIQISPNFTEVITGLSRSFLPGSWEFEIYNTYPAMMEEDPFPDITKVFPVARLKSLPFEIPAQEPTTLYFYVRYYFPTDYTFSFTYQSDDMMEQNPNKHPIQIEYRLIFNDQEIQTDPIACNYMRLQTDSLD